jgi:ubiquinone/menaquinone biosynthesis C-methylase UbiE
VKILFNERVAQVYDRWYETKKGLLADWFEKELMARNVELKPGGKILDVGCGTGNHIQYFLERGVKTIGVDISLPMLRAAHKKLGQTNALLLAKAEALPFKAKSLDCIVLITSLEFVEDPRKASREALRVSMDKILLGVLNKYSMTGISRRIKSLFHSSLYSDAKFYSIWELKKMLIDVLERFSMDWGSVLTLPLSLQERFGGIEKLLSFRENPLGAFLALGISTQCILKKITGWKENKNAYK